MQLHSQIIKPFILLTEESLCTDASKESLKDYHIKKLTSLI